METRYREKTGISSSTRRRSYKYQGSYPLLALLLLDTDLYQNWFGNARSKARKSFTSTDATTSTTNIDPTNTNEPSTPDLKKKRRRDTLDSIDDSPRNEQAQKKLRLGGEPSPRGVEQALPSSTLTEAAPVSQNAISTEIATLIQTSLLHPRYRLRVKNPRFRPARCSNLRLPTRLLRQNAPRPAACRPPPHNQRVP